MAPTLRTRVARTGLFVSLPAACVCLLIQAGCVGPDFHPPKPVVPADWTGPAARATSQPASAPTPVDLAAWWTTYNDPVLTSLVQRAIRGNLDLRQAQARVIQARGSLGISVAALFPTVNATGSLTRGAAGNGSSTKTPVAPGADSPHNLWQAGLDAAWEVDVFGGLRRGVEASNADLQAAMMDEQSVLVSLVAEVALDYIQLRGFQQQIEIARKNLQAQEHSADLTRQRLRSGLVSALDVANAEAQVATTASQIPPLMNSVQQNIYSLGILLGQTPESLVGELLVAGPIPPAPPDVPDGLPSELLRRRPDIIEAEAQLHAANARIGVATADLFPKFSMAASAGYQNDTFKHLTNWPNRVWSFGPSVDWNIFAAGATLSNIEVQKALTAQALLAYQKTVLTALGDVEGALIAYSTEQLHRKALVDAVAANRKAVDYSTQLYAQGQSDFLTVLVAQGLLFSAELALVQSTTALSTDLVALYKALGGGWDTSGTSSLPPSIVKSPTSQPATAPALISPASKPAGI